MNLAAILSRVAQAINDRLYQTRKQVKKANFANALSKMKDNVVRLFLVDSPLQRLNALVLALAESVEAARPDRAYPRKIKPARLQRFHSDYNGAGSGQLNTVEIGLTSRKGWMIRRKHKHSQLSKGITKPARDQ